MTKRYYCKRYPGYSISGVCKFENGVLVTDDESVQAAIEAQDWFGVHIFGGDPDPLDMPRTAAEVHLGMRSTKPAVVDRVTVPESTRRAPERPVSNVSHEAPLVVAELPAGAADALAAAALIPLDERVPISKTDVGSATKERLFAECVALHVPVTGDEKRSELQGMVREALGYDKRTNGKRSEA